MLPCYGLLVMEIRLNTSVLPAVLRSRDIQGLFFTVAQSKNEDRDIKELQQ